MSMEQAIELMATYPPSIAAAKKFPDMPEGFAFYKFSWLDDSDIMKVTGGKTRLAKGGKYKGRPILDKAEPKIVVYVTQAEINTAFMKGGAE